MDIAIHPIINEENGLPFIVCGIGSQSSQCPIVRKKGYNLHQIIFSTKGKGILKTNKKDYEISEGDYFYLRPHEHHEYHSLTDTWATDWILFRGNNVEKTLNKLDFSSSKTGCFKNNHNIKNLINDIIITLKGNDCLKGFIASNQLYRLLIELYRTSNESAYKDNEQNANIIEPVIQYIDKNFSKDITLETLAKVVNITPNHLCKVFKEHLYMRPFEFITKRRIQESKKMLLSSNMTIKDICRLVGYKDTSYFCALFKKHELISPSKFRGSV